jgi:hypothetical protein
MTKSTLSLLFLDIDLPPGAPIPRELLHRVDAHFTEAPPGHQEFHASGGGTTVDRRPVVKISPPLQGDKYIAVGYVREEGSVVSAASGTSDASSGCGLRAGSSRSNGASASARYRLL